MSLNRALSKLGVASRTQADALIEDGRVRVNGLVVRETQCRIDMRVDRIFVDNAPVRPRTKVYLALHKPRGMVTTRRDEQGRATVYDCLGAWGRAGADWLAPVGRLDKASSGLLLFTNDHVWAQRLLDPTKHVSKTYHVQIDRHWDEAALEVLRRGMLLPDGARTRPLRARVIRQGEKTQWLEIVLEEGMNRQIRRMAAALGAEVLALFRVAIGAVALGDLKKGEYRHLSPDEVAALGGAVSED